MPHQHGQQRGEGRETVDTLRALSTESCKTCFHNAVKFTYADKPLIELNSSFLRVSNEQLRFIGASLCRFVAPVVTRFILDIGGRNTYAAVQFLVCGLSSMIVLRTVLLFNKQKTLADGEGVKT